MLPPVSAVTAGEFFSQSVGQKQEAAVAPVNQRSVPQIISDTAAHSPAITARTVSGEVQLHQNGTVLTEVLGSLVGLERTQGEDADAYVNRLTLALRSLPAEQKAALEQQLGKLLKGMSVAILLDVLKNPTGPNAARLAIILELTRVGRSEDGTKVALPPYLQDLLPESPVLTLRPATMVAGTAPSLSRPQAEALDAGRADLPALPQSETHREEAPLPAMKTITTAPQSPTKLIATPPLAFQGAEAGPIPRSDADTSASPSAVTSSRTSRIPVHSGLNPNSPQSAAAPGRAGLPLSFVPNPDMPDTTTDDFTNEDALATLLKADAAAIATQFRGATPQDMENLLLAVLLGKVPKQGEPLPATAAAPGAMPAGEAAGPEEQQKLPAPSAHQAQVSHPDALGDDKPAPTVNPEPNAAAKTASGTDGKPLLLEHATLQSAVASLVTKTATPLPFVNYPIEEQQPDEETPPRGRWPSSDGGSEGETGDEAASGETGSNDQGPDHPEEPSAQEERIAANDETIDQSVSNGAHEDGRVGDAESYYLRMGNFT